VLKRAQQSSWLRLCGRWKNYRLNLWDESYSTQKAAALRIAYNVPKSNSAQPVDDLAAAVILQDYLDNQQSDAESHEAS